MTSDEDIDNLLMEESDYESNRLREKRMEELKREIKILDEMKSRKHGEYLEIVNEKEILEITTKERQCVVHFFHKEFKRCKVMDKHLRTLALKYFKTKFVCINVENSPFLVTKLQIQVLPCVVAFLDGISVDRIVGFEGLGGTDDFQTIALEKKLLTIGVIDEQKQKGKKSVFTRAEKRIIDVDEDSE